MAKSKWAQEQKRREREMKKARQQRTKINDHLREHDYRWTQDVYVPTAGDPSPVMDDYAPGKWVLLDPAGNQTTIDVALAAIRNS